MEEKPTKQMEEDMIWITYKDDDGQLKSAPLEIFQEIAKSRGWKSKPLE